MSASSTYSGLQLLRARRAEILRVAERYGARNVRVFGSVVRGEDTAQSDIDLLVDLDPGRSLLDQAGLVIDLEELLGRRVDVATTGGLRQRLRQHILDEAKPL